MRESYIVEKEKEEIECVKDAKSRARALRSKYRSFARIKPRPV